jgi:predicted nucleic acid-binding protein
MTAPVFVDTNVLLYARDSSEPGKQSRAAPWLEHLWRERRGRTSMQVLSEYYVNLTRKLKPGLSPEAAWDDVTAFLAWRPQPVDEAVMVRGREIEHRHRLSWWDSLIVAAAELQGCQLLLSEDFQDGRSYGSVTIRSPFTRGVEEPIAAYAALPQLPRHPARGRPRRVR